MTLLPDVMNHRIRVTAFGWGAVDFDDRMLTLRNEDRLAYVRAVEALKPTGVPLEMAALQFAEMVKILEGGPWRPKRVPVSSSWKISMLMNPPQLFCRGRVVCESGKSAWRYS